MGRSTSNIPYVLMVVADELGEFRIYDPKESYKLVYSSLSYEEVKLFLAEDEYERVEGRLVYDESQAA